MRDRDRHMHRYRHRHRHKHRHRDRRKHRAGHKDRVQGTGWDMGIGMGWDGVQGTGWDMGTRFRDRVRVRVSREWSGVGSEDLPEQLGID